jgi:hypothetical protein
MLVIPPGEAPGKRGGCRLGPSVMVAMFDEVLAELEQHP